MLWFYFWTGLYLIVIILLTLRHVQSDNLEEYLVNNRSTRTLPLVFTTLATFVGGGTSIGLMAMGYESGFAAVGIGIAYVIGFGILWRFAAQMRNTGAQKRIYSLPHFLNQHYLPGANKKISSGFSAAVSGINIFIFFFLLAAQFVGMASLLKYSLDIGYQSAAIISCLVVIVYTAFAGLSGVIITDFIQFIIIVVMIIILFIPGILTDTENLQRLTELPPKMLNGTFYGILFLIALPIFIAPSVMARMDIWQRILAAKDGKTARRVSLISGLGMLPFYIIFPLVGMSIRIISEDAIAPRDVAYLFLDRHAGEFLLGFAVVGLLSALMSSGDSFLNIISISAINDFTGLKKEGRDPRKTQKQIRIASIIFGLCALVMALLFPKIVDLMVVGIGTIAIFVPVTLIALLDKNAADYRLTATWSIFSGFLVNLVFFIWGVLSPESFQPKSSFIPAFIVALLVMVLGRWWRKRRNNSITS